MVKATYGGYPPLNKHKAILKRQNLLIKTHYNGEIE